MTAEKVWLAIREGRRRQSAALDAATTQFDAGPDARVVGRSRASSPSPEGGV
jgi:hypothetical protein